ncbi:MAG: ABC transporter permease [Defluviitaleaceae bacterium]|nr:ABC transporter permease [Defluviitaleaceae bacterium]
MNNFGIIFGMFFKRALRDKANIIVLLLLPMGLIALNMVGQMGLAEMMGLGDFDADGFATVMAIVFMASFQYFAGEIILYNIFYDLRGAASERLYVSPVPMRTFVMGAAASSLMFTLMQGILIFGVTAIFFDVMWGSPLIFFAVLLVTGITSQLIGALIALLSPTRKAASAIITVFCFAQMMTSGYLFVSLGNSPFANWLNSYGTPLALSTTVLFRSTAGNYSNAMIAFAWLAGVMAVLGILVAVLAKRRARA